MKFRSDFVTNSSSSSFVVCFDKIPKSYKEVKSILFGDSEVVSVYDRSIITEEAAKTIFDDMKNQKPNDAEKIKESLHGGSYNGINYPEYPQCYNLEYNSKEYKKLWDIYQKDIAEYEKNITENFIKDNKGKYIYCFEYSDDCETGCVLEHGNVFENVKHLRVSRH